MAYDFSNFSTITINGLTGNNYLSNVIVNNSIRVPLTKDRSNLNSDHANAAIYLKDTASDYGEGIFYKIYNSNSSGTPSLYFNSQLVIDRGNLLAELEDILQDYTLDTSNIVVTGGYINFYNGTPSNTNQGPGGVGIRYSSNGTVQFRNYNMPEWYDMSLVATKNYFRYLNDVDVFSSPLQNNQYIIYDSGSNLFVNADLSIINDTNPTLGGDLDIGNYLIQSSATDTRIVYNSGGIVNNNLLVLENTTATTNDCNYLQISNNDGTNPVSLTAMGMTSSNVGLDINTSGIADMTLNASLGNVNVNSDSLVISGTMRNSIYRTSTKPGGYLPATTWNIPINTDTILFDFSNTTVAGTYWANVAAGLDGQKLNLIYNSKTSNTVSVLANFGNGGNGLVVGTGYTTGLEFKTTGQSVSLVYVGDGIDAWHLLNAGAAVF